MVAGGLTFAVPGMEPAYATNHNPHLRVSAEGLSPDNTIASTNIIQVTVTDDLNDDADSQPSVEVDGNRLEMYRHNGAWYGYFADDDILNSGLIVKAEATPLNEDATTGRAVGPDGIEGTPIHPATDTADADAAAEIPAAVMMENQKRINALVKDNPGNNGANSADNGRLGNGTTSSQHSEIEVNDARNPTGVDPVGDIVAQGTDSTNPAANDGNEIPNVGLFDLDGTFDVIYKRAGGDETVTLDLDDPNTNIILDRTTYPQNTDVVATITDLALNVDPTSKDVWYLNTDDGAFHGDNAGGNVTKYVDADTAFRNAMAMGELILDEDDPRSEIAKAKAAYDKAIADAMTKRAADIEYAKNILSSTRANLSVADYTTTLSPTNDFNVAVGLLGYNQTKTLYDIGPDLTNADGTSLTDGLVTEYGSNPFASYQNTVGKAQTDYERVVGHGGKNVAERGALGDNNAYATDYRGTAADTLYGVLGEKQFAEDVTLPEGDSIDSVTLADDGANFVAYRTYVGTAQTASELILGHGTPSITTANGGDPDGTNNLVVDEAGNLVNSADSPVSVLVGTANSYPLNFIGTAELSKRANSAIIPNTPVKDIGSFELNKNDVVDCVNNDCTTMISDNNTWVKFTETDSNKSTFDNTDNDAASLKTIANAQRGLAFSVTYDDTRANAGIGYSTTTIEIDTKDVWNSGVEAKVTLTDSDANTNSLTEDDLKVTNAADDIIPTITIGDPFTLATVDKVMVGNDNIGYSTTTISKILVFTDDQQITADDKLTFTLGPWNEVNDHFPQDAATFKGIHMLNYDVSALANADNITLRIGNNVDQHIADIDSDGRGTMILSDADFDHTGTAGLEGLYENDGSIREFGNDMAYLDIAFDDISTITADKTAIVIDVFGFGLENDEDLVNNAIYRLELEEKGNNSSDFEGTIEYIGINQFNAYNRATYDAIDAIDNNIILISDDDSVSVEYHDLDATGNEVTFTAVADTPTHTGTVKLDTDTYKVSQTVTVTVTDPDLNADSGKRDIYSTFNNDATNDNYGKISSTNAPQPLFSVAIDGETWNGQCSADLDGLMGTQFTLRETTNDSGVFTGTFAVPEMHCMGGNPTSVTGTDITAEYVDFRDDSGSLVTISDTAGIRSSTGSVSLDRSVYPVPFGSNQFDTHDSSNPLPPGELKVYVSIDDGDFNTSTNGVDSIPLPDVNPPLEIKILRGSTSEPVNIQANEIDETGPNTGIFELEVPLDHTKGPAGRILQGDILNVIYTDKSDASGSVNTITDSATFDLRNGVLQSDKSVYVMGTDLLLTLIEPDLNLDSSATETYPLTLIEWDSDAGAESLDHNVFSANPSNLLESGENTGIFHVTITVPSEIDGERLQRGEEITLTYNDEGPSGSNYVGDKDEEITHTVYTSNFGATITLDQRVYTWTDKVFITVTAPDHNIDSDQIDEIGNNGDYPVRISTRGHEIDQYKLVETNSDTGIFTGEVIMTGFAHDADGDGTHDTTPDTSLDKSGPTNGKIEVESESGISVSFKYSDGETVSASALVRWNVGEVEWLEASYPATGTGIVRIIDPDMNLNPEAVDNFDVTVWSDSDSGGINLSVAETSDATGIFEGSVVFGVEVDTSGHRLRVSEGDTVTAQYYDNTLPAPFKETERVRVGATTLIGTIVPPLQRAPIADLRAVDSFGNTLDVISVDSQIQLTADLTNGQDKEQDFAYLIQIHDENGVTVSLNWITGTLAPGQSFSPAASWTPTEAGTYKVTAFVWESIENPTALSPTASLSLTVN